MNEGPGYLKREEFLFTDLPKRMQEKISINENGCWIWNGARLERGHGHLVLLNQRKWKNSHRHAYEMAYGEIGDSNLVLHHECFTPPCTNPHHLLLTTRKNNIRIHFQPNLTTEQVREIRKDMDALVEKHGINPRGLASIANRRTWSEID